MGTNTITLPRTEYQQLREIASRFELIKSLIEPDMFAQPPTKDAKSIIKDFKKTGLYNEKFLSSLEAGLKESTYFNN